LSAGSACACGIGSTSRRVSKDRHCGSGRLQTGQIPSTVSPGAILNVSSLCDTTVILIGHRVGANSGVGTGANLLVANVLENGSTLAGAIAVPLLA